MSGAQQQSAEYIGSILVDLMEIADAAKLRFLVYMLDMARIEAATLAKSATSVAPDHGGDTLA